AFRHRDRSNGRRQRMGGGSAQARRRAGPVSGRGTEMTEGTEFTRGAEQRRQNGSSPFLLCSSVPPVNSVPSAFSVYRRARNGTTCSRSKPAWLTIGATLERRRR